MSTDEKSHLDELDLARVDELRALSAELDVVVEAMGIESEEAQTIMGKMDAAWIVMPNELKDIVSESDWFLLDTKWDGRVI